MTLRNITGFSAILITAGTLLIGCAGCTKEEQIIKNPEYDEINDLIRNLNYDANTLLRVQDTKGATAERTETDKNTTSSGPTAGKIRNCQEKTYSLEKNFDGISILRPTNGIIWPGALVYADGDLLNGTPRPVTLDRSPMQLRINLPGMGTEGTLEIENPSDPNVQSNIDKALEWWNANAYQDGYVNPSLSDYATSVSYSSEQLGIDLGLNVEWASGSVASQLSYTTSTEKLVAMMVFKQVFYTVTMTTPKSPAEVFAPDVPMSSVQAAFNESKPPAYISSVSYGRIVMFRLETTNTTTSADLNAVLRYAGGVDATGTVNSEYDAILRESNITVVTIGGNAELASEAVTASGPGSLAPILVGKNAVYRRDNPGVPIGYTVQYLKDHRLAKMGYTTDYTIKSCETREFVHRDILIKNKFKVKNIRVKLSYLNKDGERKTTSWKTIKDETYEGIYLPRAPDGAYEVVMNVEKFNLGNGWTHFTEKNLGHVNRADEGCWVAYEKSWDEYFRKCVDEH